MATPTITHVIFDMDGLLLGLSLPPMFIFSYELDTLVLQRIFSVVIQVSLLFDI